MRNLIPHFIHERFGHGERTGVLAAATLFVDVTGFTTLTEALMQHGKEGAEILTAALNQIFSPLVHEVYLRDGWVATFVGDAFMAFFPHRDAPQQARTAALETAAQLLAFLQQNSAITTRYGDFTFSARAGLSDGTVHWGILGADAGHTYYFNGTAVAGCTYAEGQAGAGEVAADRYFGSTLTADLIGHFQGDYAILSEFLPPPRPMSENPPTTLSREALQPFVLDAVITMAMGNAQAEFRQVVNSFISFDIPPENADLLEPFVITVLDTAAEHGGYFNKLDFGDKGPMILLLFGAPIAHENDLERAADFLKTLRARTTPSPLNAVRWRAGVTYGTVYAGIMGSAERCEYTAIGDVVNLASRLTTAAPWGEVYLSEAAASGKTIKTDYLGAHPYKGFALPQPTYRFTGRKVEESVFFEQPLIGRQAELAHLLTAAQPIFAGRFGGVACITGDAGLGKSHLAYEVQHTLSQHHEVTWFTAQADQILRQAFNPFTYFLRHYFNQLPDATSEQNKRHFEARYQALLAALEKRRADAASAPRLRALEAQIEELRRVPSMLGALVGLHWPGSLYEALEGRLRYENTLVAIKTLLLAETFLKPVVLLLEDLHWLDPASHDVLTTLCRAIDDYPLFILMTSRYRDDGSRPALPLPPGVPLLWLDLETLTPSELRQLARVILDGDGDEGLIALLQDRTQSNPFFAQQFLYYFRENDLLERTSENSWRLKSLPATEGPSGLPMEVPTTINAILIARVDRLTQNVKDVVKAAAVLGREFDDRILAQMLAADIAAEVHVAEQQQIWSQVNG